MAKSWTTASMALILSSKRLRILIAAVNGINIDSLLYALLASALLTLSVIDFRTFEIPVGINYFILALGLIMSVYHYTEWLGHVIGFFAVSIPLFIIIIVTDGRRIGFVCFVLYGYGIF